MESIKADKIYSCIPKGRDKELFLHSTTYNCAVQNRCIPCLYKIFPDGAEDNLLKRMIVTMNLSSKTMHSFQSTAELDEVECKTAKKFLNRVDFPRNVRPEMCPRSTEPAHTTGAATIMTETENNLYSHLESDPIGERFDVLTVGDGDFSFSLSLAEQLLHVSQGRYSKV
jgi:hypothetical protein